MSNKCTLIITGAFLCISTIQFEYLYWSAFCKKIGQINLREIFLESLRSVRFGKFAPDQNKISQVGAKYTANLQKTWERFL